MKQCKKREVFQKGDLVWVNQPQEKKEKIDLCMVVAITIPCVYKINDFFMVYSVKNKQKFITTHRFMTKIT